LEVTVNRTELIARVSQSSGLSRRDAEAAFEHTIHEITSAVRGGDSVRITGFGTFRPRDRAARQGRNPQTGAAVRIKASKGIAFSAGATLKSQLNSRGALPKPSVTASSNSSAAPATPSRPAAKKTAAKKTTARKTTARKAPAKKTTARKTTARKAPAKKTATKRAPAKKAATKRAPAKKAAVRKAPAKKTATKRAPAKKTTAKRAPAKTATAKRTTKRR
jgi:DNA-binding protein HU-beta